MAGAWALAFGCAVGWGAFVMPGNTFLPIAGPVGTTIGIGIGAIVMLLLGLNYHFLMNRFSGSGGTYTYTKECFGYDHGFLSAWFLVLTYIAIIWANATALPLIARTLLGSTFQFGFLYEIAGYQVYLGEVLLAACALIAAALLTLRRKVAEWTQILMAVLLFGGIVACFVVATGSADSATAFSPPHSPANTPVGGVLTIFALTPWAFVGFESISHSTQEAKFPLKRTFLVMAAAVVCAAVAYSLLALLAITALPEGCGSWVDYVANLGDYQGASALPTFFASFTSWGGTGLTVLGIAALCGIFTGLIGNYIALSRLLCALSEDDMVPGWVGQLDAHCVPRRAILCIMGISIVLPFFGRTAISWIVDVTTVGATIAYAFASASAWKTARGESSTFYTVTGALGIAASVLFAVEFLIPNIISVQTLSTESYLILAAWGILGFVYFRYVLQKDDKRRLGRSIVAWVVLLGLIIFTSTVWMLQTSERSIEETVTLIEAHYEESYQGLSVEEVSQSDEPVEYVSKTLSGLDDSISVNIAIQMVLIVVALAILLNTYSVMQRREKQIEVEKALAEESSRAKTSFLSNMNHEIRTPMNAIIGLDNIALRNPDLSPKTRDQLEKIGASAQHLLGLINDILDMSRIESGRMTLKDEEFSLREFIDQVSIIINGQCVDKGLQYKCRIIGSVSDYYYGDDMKLKQVLINILGNSVKFTDPPGEVSFTIEEIRRVEDVCTMRFTMTDTGIGMDKEYIPKLFDAFTQEDDSAANKYGGSGLGMAITKNYVDMMGGTIDVQSTKGVGSTFTIVVALKASERIAHAEDGLALPAGLSVLVVDDDEVACEHAQEVLRSIGVEAEVTTDPQEALSLAQAAHDRGEGFQLVITDCRMQPLDGLEITRAIRAFDNGKTAIILLTGYNWDDIEDEANEAGVDAILAKPLFPDTLARRLYSIFLEKGEFELAAAPEPQVDEPQNNLAGRRMLMAEDVEQNAEILMDLFELEDVTVEHAANGERAVQMFQESEAGYYDAILMDVRMPVMDGLTATSAIRALDHPDAKDIPIIAMTGNVFDEDVERSLQAGMNAHLSKPIEPDRLFETIAQLIAQREREA